MPAEIGERQPPQGERQDAAHRGEEDVQGCRPHRAEGEVEHPEDEHQRHHDRGEAVRIARGIAAGPRRTSAASSIGT